MEEKVIFHIDINHCYAQIEEMLHPRLHEIPMAVGGHEEKRHGIILAKNDIAKKEGIKTGESLREAYRKDPDLLIIPPHYEAYIYYTDKVKKIYKSYSDKVESFGLDEAWIDYTDSVSRYGSVMETAREIQQRVFRETGLMVSVGESWNKAFAKLGSDMKKPYGLTSITKENYKEKVWPQPCGNLIYVGPASCRMLHERGILTIGDLANYPVSFLKKKMGVSGEVIHSFANGNDPSPVEKTNHCVLPKSIGNSMTMIHDVYSLKEIQPVYYVLCEAVASRMREQGVSGNLVGVSFRTAGLDWFSAEEKTLQKTNVSEDIFLAAMHILQKYDFSLPLRAVGVFVGNLLPSSNVRQLDLFVNEQHHEKARRTDLAMDSIRNQYGFYAVRRGCTLLDRPLTEFDVKNDHTVHPVGYFQNRRMAA